MLQRLGAVNAASHLCSIRDPDARHVVIRMTLFGVLLQVFDGIMSPLFRKSGYGKLMCDTVVTAGQSIQAAQVGTEIALIR